jgi:tellurite resistance protein TehA-like permease
MKEPRLKKIYYTLFAFCIFIFFMSLILFIKGLIEYKIK